MRDIKPVIGYVHTGIEKNCEDKAYWKVIPLVERMDYLSYYFNAMAYCGAVETLLEHRGAQARPVPARRSHMELNRIASHLLWLATGGLDLGAMSVFWYGWRDRDLILDLFEMSSGQRMHPRYFQVGGVAEDIPTGFEAKKCEAFTAQFPKRLDQFEDADRQQPDRAPAPARRRRRRRGHAAAPRRHRPAAARRRQPVGPAQGRSPTASYEDFDFKIPVGTVGDNYDRYRVRMAEMRESLKIIDQALDGLPEGDYITSDRKYALPPRHELATSMEALIHHFKLVTEGFRVPPGEAYYPIESPRGELGCFVRSDGSSKPARVHMRDPSLREPAGAAADGAGHLHRRPDRRRSRCSTRSSEGSTGDGDRSEPGQALRPRLARPGLGLLRRPHEGPGGRPRSRDDLRARRTCATAIEALMAQVPGHPLAPRSRR